MKVEVNLLQKKSASDIIVEALRKGSKPWGELEKLCVQNGCSRSAFGRAMKKLMNIEKSIKPEGQWAPGQSPKTVYSLVPEGYRGDKRSRTKAAIDRFYDINGRYPDPEELALEMGDITPKEAKGLAFRTRSETRWRPPTEMEKKDQRRELGESLVLAAKIKADPATNWVKPYYYTDYDVELARYYLETYSELVPTITEDKRFSWPDEAKRYLGDNYVPIRRGMPITRSE